MYSQGKSNMSAAIIMSGGKFHNIMWLHNAKNVTFWLIHGNSEAWKWWIQVFISCRKLVNPLPSTLKVNGTWQQLSSCLGGRFHNTMWLHHAKMWHFSPCMATLRPGSSASMHLDHVESLTIHYHALIRQMAHGSGYHHVWGKVHNIMWLHHARWQNCKTYQLIRGYSEACKWWIHAFRSCRKLI